MRTPGFTATASLSQTSRGGVYRTRRAFLAETAVIPAQEINWPLEAILRTLSARRASGKPWALYDPPIVCPLGTRAVWVNLPERQWCVERDPRGKCTKVEKAPAISEWQCQSVLRVAIAH